MQLNEKEAKIIILCGKARSGKDTTLGFLKNIYENKGLKVINLAYAYYIKEYAKHISDWDGRDETKPRELLQELGTEVIRNKIDKHFFIKRIIEDIKVYSYFFDIIIISDARVPEEIDIIKKTFKDVKSVKIERPLYESELLNKEKAHITEVGLDNYTNYDYVLTNDGNLKELEEKVIILEGEM